MTTRRKARRLRIAANKQRRRWRFRSNPLTSAMLAAAARVWWFRRIMAWPERLS